jgi:peptidyl-prolyl cis-trans isomerase D
VSDEEVEAYYNENKESFVKPESVDVSFIELKQLDFADAMDVTEDEIINLYESEKSAYETVEERDASHILVKIDDQRTEAEAEELINQIANKIGAGEDFANLASEFSEDEGSAQSGGSLGPSARGVYVADFEDALFALNEGEVSSPVKTEFGYHLIKLDRIIATGLPELAEVRDRLETQLKDQKAAQLFAERAEELADISYSSSDLAEPADALGLEVKQLASVSAATTDRVFSNPKVQRVLFSEELVQDGNNSELIDLDDGYAVVFRVDQFNAAGTLSFEEVQDRIRDELVVEKASEFAESVGQAFIVRVAAGEQAPGVAQDMGLEWTFYEEAGRNNADVNGEVLQRVFAIKEAQKGRDSIVGFVSGRGDFEIAVLEKITAGDGDSLSQIERDSVAQVLSENAGALEYRNYREGVQRQAEVEEI